MPHPRPTLHDIAAAAGVSRSAAARVLLGTGGDHVRVSVETRARIEEAARRLKYSPNQVARQLRGVASRTLGVILDTENTPVMTQRLFAIEAEAARRNYRLLIGQIHRQPAALAEYVNDFTGRSIGAILCLFDLSPGRDQRARSAFESFRKVVFHYRPAWRGGFAVKVDTDAALRSCVTHLVERGRRRLVLNLWNEEEDELMQVRRKAFESCIAELNRNSGVKVKGHVWNAHSEFLEPHSRTLDEALNYTLKRCRADALIASNDVWATRFILELQKRGVSIPGDVAVVGYDNLDIAEVITPALTTIDQEHAAYAGAAVDLLLKLAAEEEIPAGKRISVVMPKLVVRESS